MTTRPTIDIVDAQKFICMMFLGQKATPEVTCLIETLTEPFMLEPGASKRGRALQLLTMLWCKDDTLPEYNFPGRDEFARKVEEFTNSSDDVPSSDGTTAAFCFQTSSALTSQGWTAPTHNDTGTTPKAASDDIMSS